MIRYLVAGDRPWSTPDGDIAPGVEFDAELDQDEETAALDRGLLAIVPATYVVVGTSVVHDAAPGQKFTRALRPSVEALLVAGGHIVRADPAYPPAKPTKKKE